MNKSLMVNTSEWVLAVTCSVLHYQDCLSKPESILLLVEEFRTNLEHIQLDKPLAAIQLERLRPRYLKPTERNWSRVLGEIREGQLATFGFGSLAPDGDSQLGVWFQLHGQRNRQRSSSGWLHYNTVTFDIAPCLVENGSFTTEMIRNLLLQAWSKLDGVYGFADVFATHRTGLVSPDERQRAARTLAAKIFRGVDVIRSDPQAHVPDAYWLNFLNHTHLEVLGGVDSLTSRLPNADIRPLPKHGASIQISRSPMYDLVEEWKRDHEQLNAVLAPLVVER
jgi:hypothetical protein